QHGLRSRPNPVIAKFAFLREPRRKARPFSQEELAAIWKRLEDSGTALLRAAAAIGEECGLRYSEVLNVRLQDVDLDRQQLFVRLPTKNNDESWVPFTDIAKAHLAAWLKARPNSP